MSGIFTISLDFELFWGMRDHSDLDRYGANIRGVGRAVPELLQSFTRHSVHATWATVGFLFCRDATDFRANIPLQRPGYQNRSLCPYQYFEAAEQLEHECHFAPDLIDLISATKGQELATHTYSHFYCLEQGQTLEEFRADMQAAVVLAERSGVKLKSLVFPRNQWNQQYLGLLPELGIRCFRGNESGWMYRASDAGGEGLIKRAFRLADSYINLSGANTYAINSEKRSEPLNLPSSRFLRPFNRRLKILDGLRLRRIKNAMTYAARKNQVFHLWWHPHNFGANMEENLRFLEKILEHYQMLNRELGMRSLNMGEIAA